MFAGRRGNRDGRRRRCSRGVFGGCFGKFWWLRRGFLRLLRDGRGCRIGLRACRLVQRGGLVR